MRVKYILLAAVAAPLMLGTATVSFVPAQAQTTTSQDIKKARKDATRQLKQARKEVKQAEKQLKKAQKNGNGVEAAQAALANAQQNLTSAEQQLQAAMAAKPSSGNSTPTQQAQDKPIEEMLGMEQTAEDDQRAKEEELRKARAERRRQREEAAAKANAAEQEALNEEKARIRRAERKRQREQEAAEANAAEDADTKEQAEAEAEATEKAADQQLLEDEQRRKRRAERRKRLREQEAKTGGKDDGTVEIIRESEAVGTELDDRQARQLERMRKKLRDQRKQIRELENTQTDVGEEVVRRTRDGRIIVRRDDQLIIRDPGDDQRFLRRARDVVVEDLPRGRTRIVVTRPDGTKIITIKNRRGDIVYRVRRRPNGREFVLIDNRNFQRKPGIDFTIQLPRLVVPIPRDEYIVDLESANRRQLHETLIAPPVEPVERVYSLEEVRQSERLRDKVRRIDLDTITFPSGSAEISPNQVLDLAEIGYAMEEALIENSEAVFFVEGHTDAVGSDYYNLELSDRRAESVAIVLSENFDIPPENLITQGYGEEFLKIPTLGSEQRNRRVTIRPITDLIRPSAG